MLKPTPFACKDRPADSGDDRSAVQAGAGDELAREVVILLGDDGRAVVRHVARGERLHVES
jgi:hypothetical protein